MADAYNAPSLREALISMIVALQHQAEKKVKIAEEKLKTNTNSDLKKLALDLGASAKDMAEAYDAPSLREALIEIIMDLQSKAEKEFQTAVVNFKTKKNTDLRAIALGLGASESKVTEADDAPDLREALIHMIVDLQRKAAENEARDDLGRSTCFPEFQFVLATQFPFCHRTSF